MTGGLWVVIPVKPLGMGKSRLSSLLPPAERRRLNQRLLRHVLEVAIEVVGAARTIVVSADPAVLATVRTAGAQPCRERGRRELNRALALGARCAMRRGARAVLTLSIDLPELRVAELRQLVDAAGWRPSVVAAADRLGSGTNALLVAPPGAIRYRFGRDSLREHRRAALRHGCRWRMVDAPGLAFDLDRPADYRGWMQRRGSCP